MRKSVKSRKAMRKSVKSRKSMRKSVKARKSVRKSVKSRKSLRKSVKSRKSLRKSVKSRKMNDGMDRPEPETKEDILSKIPEETRRNEIYSFLENSDKMSLSSTNKLYRKEVVDFDKSDLSKVPKEIKNVINKFLGNSGRKSLSSTNKLYRHKVDFDRNFSYKGSIEFIKFFYDPSVTEEKKEERIKYLKNSKISLKLNIEKGEDDILSNVFTKYFNKNPSKYSNSLIHTLDLDHCEGITDVSALGKDNHTLSLRGCEGITDVSALGRVHTLDLSGCRITDVSQLGRVHTLDLSNCQRITDVSMLGGVHTLDLSYCGNITDVSMLRGVVPNLRL